jgi:hypothetical protein
MKDDVCEMIPEAEKSIELSVDYKGDRQDWPVSRVVLMQHMEYILFKGFGYIRELADKFMILQDEDIVVQIAKAKKSGGRIQQKADEYD